MGGKSYFCDYCNCFLKNDINVRKVHNEGIAHKIAKANYMQKYEDPRVILQKEMAKSPCTRYKRRQCKFDFYCQFTHYSHHEIQQLKEIVQKMENGELTQSKEERIYKKQRSKRAKLKRMKMKNLPPSLRSQEEIIKSTIFMLPNEWG